MLDGDHRPLADVKNRFSEVVEQVEAEHARVVVTKHGRPAAVLLSVEDLESLEESLAVMGNPDLVDDLRDAQSEIEAGGGTPLSKDEALAIVRRRR